MSLRKKKKFRVLLVYPNPPMLGVVPGNMALLAACLKKAGFEVKLFDMSIYRTVKKTQDDLRADLNQVKRTNVDDFINWKEVDVYEDFRKVVEKYKPGLIGITVVDDTLSMAIKLLEKVKDKKMPKIVGGVGATFNYEKILRHGMVDMVCRGEGERALVELSKKLSQGKDWKRIKNLCFVGDKGEIVTNPLRKLVDINKLPFYDFSIFDKTRFYRPFHGQVVRMAMVDTDRGCPYSCTYCAAPSLRKIYSEAGVGKYFRVKSVDKVMSEVKHLVKKYKINFIWFSSETFFARDNKELEEFAKRYKKEVGLPFWCQTRLDTFTDFRTKLLAEMGCKAVSVGLEHGSEKFRREILKKFISNQSILTSFKMLHKYNIPATVNNIVGFPDETRDLVFETVKTNRMMDKYVVSGSTLNTFIFTPYSGTPLRDECVKKGYIDEKSEDNTNMYAVSVVKMSSMSKEEIEGLQKTMPFYIKLPKKYFPMIKLAEGTDDKAKEMFKEMSEILVSLNK